MICSLLRPNLTTSYSSKIEGRDRWAEANTRLTVEEEVTETERARKVEEKLKGPDRGKRRATERMHAGRLADRQTERGTLLYEHNRCTICSRLILDY